MLGWRVYVTNQVDAQLSLKQAIRAYRDEYLTERGFARFKGFPRVHPSFYYSNTNKLNVGW